MGNKWVKRKFRDLMKCFDLIRPNYTQFFLAGCLLTNLHCRLRLNYTLGINREENNGDDMEWYG